MTIGIRRKEGQEEVREYEISEEERNTRIDLAACYRLIAHFGMNELTYNHISARIPGPEEEFLLNPFGLMFHEVTASSLVKINVAGKVLNDPVGLGINEAGFVLHGAIHEARSDLTCVIHTHTPAGMAVSAQADGLLPLTQTAMMFTEQLGYHDFEGFALDLDERKRLIADLGSHSAMILRNHGLLVGGSSISEAFNAMFFLENACRAQVQAMGGGAKLNFPSMETARKVAEVYRSQRFSAAERDWAAMLRLADRLDPGFRD